MKREPSEWEKIITNETTDQELISKVYKDLMHLKPEKWKIWQKLARRLNRHFSKKDIQMANDTWTDA